MSEFLNFETYLLISPKKFSINVLAKSNSETLYKDETLILNNVNEIDYDLLNNFLNRNIFKIEKKLKNFIKNINLIVGFNIFFPVKISIKKSFHGSKISNKDLNYLLQDIKKQCQNTIDGNKIAHIIIENYRIDEKNYPFFPDNINCNNLVIDVAFISIPLNFLDNFDNILKNYHISTNHVLSANYLNEFFSGTHQDIVEMAKKITEGCNPNEVLLVHKPVKNKGFFEKFFHFFN